MDKIKYFLKEIFEIEKFPDKELYFLVGIFVLIIMLSILDII